MGFNSAFKGLKTFHCGLKTKHCHAIRWPCRDSNRLRSKYKLLANNNDYEKWYIELSGQ